MALIAGQPRLKAGLVLSVLINVALAAKILVFDANTQVRPLCWDERRDEVVALDGTQSGWYLDEFRYVGGRFGTRLDAEGYYYVSLPDYWKHEQFFWNATTHVVNRLVLDHGDQMKLPPYEIDGYGNVKVTCDLVRAVAIRP